MTKEKIGNMITIYQWKYKNNGVDSIRLKGIQYVLYMILRIKRLGEKHYESLKPSVSSYYSRDMVQSSTINYIGRFGFVVSISGVPIGFSCFGQLYITCSNFLLLKSEVSSED